MTESVAWYFDFISPFSYLQTARFGELPDNVEIVYRPVLLAGLLGHYGTQGPAEIAPKRTFTYRHCTWLARHIGTSFRMPPAHPFNSLKALRLCLALGSRGDDVTAIFNAIWVDGHLPDTEAGWNAICGSVGIETSEADALIRTAGVKQELRANFDSAVSAGVFGVPTFVFREALFWGLDATGFLIDALNDPALLKDPELIRVANLPVAARRSQPNPDVGAS